MRPQLSDDERLGQRLTWMTWGVFGCFVVCGILLPADQEATPGLPYRLFNWATYGFVLLMFREVASRYRPLMVRASQQNGVFKVMEPLLAVILFGVATGFLFTPARATFYQNLGWEFMPMLGVILALATGAVPAVRDALVRHLPYQSAVAGAYSLYVVQAYPVLNGRGDIVAQHYFALSMSSIAIMAIANVRQYTLRQQFSGMLGYIGYAYMTIAYQSRGNSVIFLVLFPALLLMSLLGQRTMAVQRRRLVLLTGVTALAIVGALRLPDVSAQVNAGVQGTIERWLAGDVNDDYRGGVYTSTLEEVETGRGAEAAEFISVATPFTWLFGHGWGGSWNSQVMAGGLPWSVVHFGPLHLVLKGGLPLCILFQILIGAAVIRSAAAMFSDPHAPATFCYLSTYYLGFLKHGPLPHGYPSYVLWMAIGIALSIPKRQIAVRRSTWTSRRFHTAATV